MVKKKIDTQKVSFKSVLNKRKLNMQKIAFIVIIALAVLGIALVLAPLVKEALFGKAVSSFRCIGANPANTVLCSGDNQQLVENTLKRLVTVCTDEQKCEYICAPRYELNLAADACVARGSGESGSAICGTMRLGRCTSELTCTTAGGFWNGQSCIAKAIAGGSCLVDAACQNGLTCQNSVCVVPTFVCTGVNPVNAVICSGDAQQLTSNTPKRLVTTCTSAKCEYTCIRGFIPNGARSACILAAVCSARRLDLCRSSTTCITAGGYWNGQSCVAKARQILYS